MFVHIIQHITSIDIYKNLQQIFTGCCSALPEKFNSWLGDFFQSMYDIWEAKPRSYQSPIIAILFVIIKRLCKLILNFPIKVLYKVWKPWTLHSQKKNDCEFAILVAKSSINKWAGLHFTSLPTHENYMNQEMGKKDKLSRQSLPSNFIQPVESLEIAISTRSNIYLNSGIFLGCCSTFKYFVFYILLQNENPVCLLLQFSWSKNMWTFTSRWAALGNLVQNLWSCVAPFLRTRKCFSFLWVYWRIIHNGFSTNQSGILIFFMYI